MDQLYDWAAMKAAVIFAALSGAVIQVSVAWSSPKIAARQFIACVLVGINFGPSVHRVAAHYMPASGAWLEGATICGTGLCGIYIAEGLFELAKRWRDNPSIFWRKP